MRFSPPAAWRRARPVTGASSNRKVRSGRGKAAGQSTNYELVVKQMKLGDDVKIIALVLHDLKDNFERQTRQQIQDRIQQQIQQQQRQIQLQNQINRITPPQNPTPPPTTIKPFGR